MDIEKLSDRAMGIRSRFADFERARLRREWTKEEVMQGFVVDVGDLMKLVMAKSGIREVGDVDRKLAHELSDCLWSVLVLSRMYGVDLASEFMKTMDELDAAIAAKQAESDWPLPLQVRVRSSSARVSGTKTASAGRSRTGRSRSLHTRAV